MSERQIPITCDCCNEEHIIRMTDLKSLTDAELRAENRAILRELSARRKAKGIEWN